MGLTCTWPSDQHHVVGIFQELAPVQLAHQGFVDFAVAEVKASQISIRGEPGHLELVGHRAHFALGGLGLEQLGQDGLRCVEGRRTLLSQFRNRLSHAMHLELAQPRASRGRSRTA